MAKVNVFSSAAWAAGGKMSLCSSTAGKFTCFGFSMKFVFMSELLAVVLCCDVYTEAEYVIKGRLTAAAPKPSIYSWWIGLLKL